MKKNWTLLFLTLIVLLGFFLRIWKVDKFPAGFNADEAAIGYNAYSILQTGKDEYGSFLPLSFKSFGDFKPGLYFYFALPFVALFGLTEFAVRFPSVILGTGTIVLIYFLSQEIFTKEKISLLASFLLAITPWHIHFSRGGWESNAATFFITLGVLLFIKTEKAPKYFFLSLVSFLVSAYLYQSPRLLAPILIIALGLYYKKILLTNYRKHLIHIAAVFVFGLPILFQFVSGQGSARFTGLSFLSDTGPGLRVNELRGEHKNQDSFFSKTIHNKFVSYGTNLLGHYFDHFTPDFLFINGDRIIRDSIPETGQLFLIESFLIFFGLIGLVKLRKPKAKLILLWLFIAPIASSMTFQTPNAVRSLNMVIPLTVISALGFFTLLDSVHVKRLKITAVLVVFALLIFEAGHFLESYFVHYPKRSPLSWEYGFSEMVLKLNRYQNDFDKVVITDKYDQPYILILFYEKYDPVRYQPQANLSERDKFNFGTVRSFDKYEFRKVDQGEIGKNPRTLYIVGEGEIKEPKNVIDTVKFPNGTDAFTFIKS